jgi:hypothetical protein
MSTGHDRDEPEDEGPWWKPDFTTILVLAVLGAILLILTFELWHTHFGAH